MKPRLKSALLVVAALAVAGATAGLALLRGPSVAFTVNGEEWSRDDMTRLMDGLVGAGQFTAPSGKVSADDMSAVMSVLVQYRSGRQLLAGRGITVPAGSIESAKQRLEPTFQDDFVVGVLADMSATGEALDSMPAPTDVKTIYEANPARTGVLCAVMITSASEKSARDILEQLDSGADAIELARKNAKGSEFESSDGTVAVDAAQPCAGLAWVKDRVSTPVFSALASTAAGAHSGIVQDATGWHVVFNRQWADVGAAHSRQFSGEPGRNLAAGFTATSDIAVSPEFGTWNQARQTIE
ncbi:MAG: hypothetical protein ACO36A_04665 [Ilumatobacteraceae bacterium]